MVFAVSVVVVGGAEGVRASVVEAGGCTIVVGEEGCTVSAASVAEAGGCTIVVVGEEGCTVSAAEVVV